MIESLNFNEIDGINFKPRYINCAKKLQMLDLLYSQYGGISIDDLAKETGYCRNTVRRRIKEFRELFGKYLICRCEGSYKFYSLSIPVYKYDTIIFRLSKNTQRKITLKEFLWVYYKMHTCKYGITYEQIMKKFRVCKSTAERIIQAILNEDSTVGELENIKDKQNRKHFGYIDWRNEPEFINISELRISDLFSNHKYFRHNKAVLYIRDLLYSESINRFETINNIDKDYVKVNYTFKIKKNRILKGGTDEK